MKRHFSKRRKSRKRQSARRRDPSPQSDRAPALAAVETPRLGLEAFFEKVIPREWTLAQFDAQLPAVLSTPAMIGMMEVAASNAIRPELPPGAISVGTRIEVDHLKAVPEETLVRATARLAEHNGRFIAFDVEARAGEHLIGRGRVYRAIVEPAKFHDKARTRKG